jgi:succinate dehydrogenase / fumarate reductase cytochrome b subunit
MIASSILKKVVMAVTGLAWFGFLVSHLSANLLIYQGAEAFNAYPVMLRKLGALLYVAEAGLVLLLLGHVFSAIRVTLENRRARPRGYDVRKTGGRSTLASRTMAIGGLILVVYIPAHVWWFKFYKSWDVPNGLWGVCVETFKNPAIVGWYLVALAALGLHLSHGLASAFQTLGLGKVMWRERLRKVGYVVGWAMAGGFASLPIWMYLVPKP